MKWTTFEESTIELPEKIVEKTIDGFSVATKGIAELTVKEKSTEARLKSKLNSRFQFDIRLVTPKLREYSYKVLEFGYGIEIYPVKVNVNPDIAGSMQDRFIFSNLESCKTDAEFVHLVEDIFKSEKFIHIVSGLMKIAANKEDELLF